jgi:hypothetical protein
VTTCSVTGVWGVLAEAAGAVVMASDGGVLERPHDQGAYHDPYRTAEAFRKTLEESEVPTLRGAD